MFKAFKIFYPAIMIILVSCSGYKYLPPNEKLYTGATIKVVTDEPVPSAGMLKSEAEKMIRPQPNTKVLGQRLKLWLYNIAGTPKKDKGFRHWVKNKLGEPPVYLSSVNPEQVSDLIDKHLFNFGVYKSRTEFKVDEN